MMYLCSCVHSSSSSLLASVIRLDTTRRCMMNNNNHSIPEAAAKRGGFSSTDYENMEKYLDQSAPTTSTSTSTTNTTVSYAQTMQQVSHLRNLANTWRSPPIMLLVAESLQNDNIISVDITKTIDTTTTNRVPRVGKRDNSNCYWLSKELSRDDVICAIKNACRLAGFKAKCRYKESSSTAGKPIDTGWLEVKCARCEFHDEVKNKAHNEKKRSTSENKTKGKGLTENKKKSTKPIKGMEGNDKLCPVCFKIYLDKPSNRWFVWRGQKGEIVHCGHKQREPLDIRLETKYLLTEEDDELADQTAKRAMGGSITATTTATATTLLPSSSTATATTLLPSTTYGPTEMVEYTSAYVVPSQRKRSEYHTNTVDDGNTGDEQTTCPGSNLLEKFLPRYETMCKTAEAADGDEGVQVMEKHFSSCQRRFLNFFYKDNVKKDDLIQPVSITKKGKARARGSLYLRFKPPLERICNMAEASGKMGIAVASEEFECCQAELTALSCHKDKLTNAQQDRRYHMVTSPSKKKPKR